MDQTNERQIVDGLMSSCALGALLYPFWFYLDLVQIAEYGEISLVELFKNPDAGPIVLKCLVIRLVVVAVMALYLFTAWTFARDRTRPSGGIILLGALAQQILGLGVISLIWTLDAFKSNYFCGLIMVSIVVAILTPWKPRYTAIQISTMTAAYIAAAWLKYHQSFAKIDPTVYSNMVFITGAGVLCWYGAWKTYRVRLALQTPHADDSDEEAENLAVPELSSSLVQLLGRAAMVLFPIITAFGAYYAVRKFIVLQ